MHRYCLRYRAVNGRRIFTQRVDCLQGSKANAAGYRNVYPFASGSSHAFNGPLYLCGFVLSFTAFLCFKSVEVVIQLHNSRSRNAEGYAFR